MKPLQVVFPPERMRMKQTPRKKTAVQSPKKIAEKMPSSRKRTRTIEEEEDEVEQSPTKRMTRSVLQQEKDSHKMDYKAEKNDKKEKDNKKEKDKKKKIEEEEEDEDEGKEEEEEEVQRPTKKEALQKTRYGLGLEYYRCEICQTDDEICNTTDVKLVKICTDQNFEPHAGLVQK
jgi:hypothetical protein